MAAPSTTAERAETGTSGVRTGLRGLMTPPAGLLQRVRWVFLLLALALAIAGGIGGAIASAAGGRPWPLTIVAAAGMAAVWLYGYLQVRFTLVTDLLCAAGIIVLGVTVPETRPMSYSILACIWMRALHSTVRQTIVAAVIFAVARVIVGALAAASEAPPDPAANGRNAISFVIVCLFSLSAAVLFTYDRAVTRQRRLRLASRGLAEARDRQSLYAAALSGARGLLDGTSGAGVELAVGVEEDMTVVAEAGKGIGAPGGHIDARQLPEALRTELHAGRAAEAVYADPALWRALDLDRQTGTVYAVPLVAHGSFEGAIVVGTDRTLDTEVKDDLQTLGDLTALALESQMLLEARGRGAEQVLPAAAAERPAGTPFERARAMSGTAPAAVTKATGHPAARSPVWPMPLDLAGRLRWIFLGACMVAALWVGLNSLLMVLQGPAQPLQVVAVTTPLWLGGWFVYGYRRGGFPLVGDVAIGVLLLLLFLGTGAPALIDPVLFLSASFRALYGDGDRRQVALAVVIHAAVLPLAVLLLPVFGGSPVDAGGRLIFVPIAVAVFAAGVHLVSVTLGRFERALDRERALRVSGAQLVAATDRGHVYAATLDGAQGLLAGTAGASILVAAGAFSPASLDGPDGAAGTAEGADAEELAVVAAAGVRAQQAAGRTILVSALPESLRAAMHQGTPVHQPRADAAAWQALDLEGPPGSLYAVPLHARGALEGAIVVGSDVPLDAELMDDLQTLASLAALALEDIVLVETLA